MRKIILTKKLNEKNSMLFKDILDIELVTIPDGEQALFEEHIKDAEAILLSTAYKMTRASHTKRKESKGNKQNRSRCR